MPYRDIVLPEHLGIGTLNVHMRHDSKTVRIIPAIPAAPQYKVMLGNTREGNGMIGFPTESDPHIL